MKNKSLEELFEICQNLNEVMFFDVCCEPEGWLVFGRDIGEDTIYPDDLYPTGNARKKRRGVIKEHHYSNTLKSALIKMIEWDRENHAISLCSHCNCMTKTIKEKCSKCREDKNEN